MAKGVLAFVLIALGVAACASPSERPKPAIWAAGYGVPFDIMANCLATRSAGAYTTTPQISPQDGVASVTYAFRNSPQIVAEYLVRRTAGSGSEVSWRRPGGGDKFDWLDVEARTRADSCGGAS